MGYLDLNPAGGGTNPSGAYALIVADQSGRTTVRTGHFGSPDAGNCTDDIRQGSSRRGLDTYDEAAAGGNRMSRQSQQAVLLDFIGRLCKALGVDANRSDDSPRDADCDDSSGGSGHDRAHDDDAFDRGDGRPRYGPSQYGPSQCDRGSRNAYGNGSPSSRNVGPQGAGNAYGSGCEPPTTEKRKPPEGSGNWAHGGSTNGQVKYYQNTGSAESKQCVNRALDGMGATNKEKALVMAMGMQEDHNFKAHDADKDERGDARNYSPFNLNKYQLRQLGFKGDAEALNDPKNVGEAAKLVLKGMRDPNMGIDRLMNLTRGGQSAENGGGDRGDLEKWRNGQKAAANEILAAGPDAFTNGARYVCDAEYR